MSYWVKGVNVDNNKCPRTHDKYPWEMEL